MLKVGGLNDFNQLDYKSNTLVNNRKVITPPFYTSLNVYSLISYSLYHNHAVWITKDGITHVIGDNTEGQISPLLPKTKFSTDTVLKMSNQNIISAVCGSDYTLYMVHDQKHGIKYFNVESSEFFSNS